MMRGLGRRAFVLGAPAMTAFAASHQGKARAATTIEAAGGTSSSIHAAVSKALTVLIPAGTYAFTG